MRWAALAMTVVALGMAQAQAADPILATQDRAVVVKLAKDAGNIIIGNPAYFDITVEDPRTLVLFGKQLGQTNMIVWDDQRREILNVPIVVIPDRGATTVRVFSPLAGGSGAAEVTYACADGACARTTVGAAAGALSPMGEMEEEGGGGPGGGPGGGGGR